MTELCPKRLITSATINIFPWFFLQLLEDKIPEKNKWTRISDLGLQKFWAHFGQIFVKYLAKMMPKIFGGLNKNSSPLVSQEFSLLTAAKRIMEKYSL